MKGLYFAATHAVIAVIVIGACLLSRGGSGKKDGSGRQEGVARHEGEIEQDPHARPEARATKKTPGEDRDWATAQAADVEEAYHAFLAKYPAGSYAESASNKMAVCRERARWNGCLKTNSVEELKAFMKAFPASSHVAEAGRLIKTRLLREVCGQELDRRKNMSTVTNVYDVERAVAIVTAAESVRPDNNDDYRLAIDVLAAFYAHPEAEPYRVTFPAIKPEGGTNCVQLKANVKPASLNGQMQGGEYKLNLVSVVAAENNRMDGSLVIATGSFPVLEAASLRKRFAANIAVTSLPMQPNGENAPSDSKFLTFTELPAEFVFYILNMSGGNDLRKDIRLPNGYGTVIRFKGEVKDFYEGFTMRGDDNYPLAFVLLSQGLTYVCGKGSVVDSEGKTWVFPAAATKHD